MKILYKKYKNSNKFFLNGFDFTSFPFILESKNGDVLGVIDHSYCIITAVSKKDNKIIGFLNIEYTPDNLISIYNIQFLEVQKNYRKMGIGSKMIDLALLELKKSGAKKVSIIDVSKSNIFFNKSFIKKSNSSISFYYFN